jgi:hypothetical protein
VLLNHAIGQLTAIRSIVEKREEAVMRPDGQGGPVGSDELAEEVWEDESPAAVPGKPSEADAGTATPEQP